MERSLKAAKSCASFRASWTSFGEASGGGAPSVRVEASTWRIRGLSKVISTLIGVISNYKYSYLSYNPSY